jgi:hypothetical protein
MTNLRHRFAGNDELDILMNNQVSDYAGFMDIVLPFVFGFLILIRSAYVLISGSASANSKGLWRDEEPMIYWVTVLAGFAMAGGLFIFAWRNWHGV